MKWLCSGPRKTPKPFCYTFGRFKTNKLSFSLPYAVLSLSHRLIERVIPEHSSHFVLEAIENEGHGVFEIDSDATSALMCVFQVHPSNIRRKETLPWVYILSFRPKAKLYTKIGFTSHTKVFHSFEHVIFHSILVRPLKHVSLTPSAWAKKHLSFRCRLEDLNSINVKIFTIQTLNMYYVIQLHMELNF